MLKVWVGVLLAYFAGCHLTVHNPAVCCETDSECAAVGFDDPQPCKDGTVCVASSCQSSGCDGNEDCAGGTAFCIAGVCAACDADSACTPDTPVCDPGSHECRRCSTDSECASGVCDLAAGSCIAENAIRFVSPGGTMLDPCSRAAPCSLAQAFLAVDGAHSFVEMTPGTYVGGATLDGKPATVIADRATLRVDDATEELKVGGQGSLTIRHLKVLTGPGGGPGTILGLSCVENSQLDVSDLDVTGEGIGASGCHSVKVSDSTFTGAVSAAVAVSNGTLTDVGVIVDRSRFFGFGPSVTGSSFFAVITNCLIVAPGSNALTLRSFTNGSPSIETHVEFNTFVGGVVDCNNPTPSGVSRRFEGNIFFMQDAALPKVTACTYNYNLVRPPDFTLGGIGNLTDDPKFVDPTSGDYHLMNGSPAVNAADPTATQDHDLDNAARPQGGRSDIGAFELRP